LEDGGKKGIWRREGEGMPALDEKPGVYYRNNKNSNEVRGRSRVLDRGKRDEESS